MKLAVFPGSFDPITLGHESMILKALSLFDKVIVAVGENVGKHSQFSLEQRLEWVQNTFAIYPDIEVDSYHELTIDYCRRHGANTIVRGLRNDTDYRYESEIAKVNKLIAPEIETIFLQPDPAQELISSTLVRELWHFGKPVSAYLPQGVILPKHP